MSGLTITEETRLTDLESIIEHGLQTFVEVGNALMEIRDSRLYRADYGTFEDYCGVRWGIERRRAYQLMDAAQVVQNVNNCTQILPTNEAQARPLTILTSQQQIEVWPIVVETAPNGKVTAVHVQSVVDDFNYKRDTRRSQPADIYTPLGMDACQTPDYALDPLLPYLQADWVIWEPARGEGYLIEALYDSGFKEEQVVTGDILTGQNFFEYEPGEWDCLVTNPPYSIQFKWLERCYQLNKPFALLLKVEILGTKTAQALMQDYGFEILLLDKRVDFKMPYKGWDSAAQFPVFWLCWKLLPERVVFGKLDKRDQAAPTERVEV